MKTIQVNGETWVESKAILVGDSLVKDGIWYTPQKKEITLDEIRANLFQDLGVNSEYIRINKTKTSKLRAIRDMILVADYLNEGWVPDWGKGNQKWMIGYNYNDSSVSIYSTDNYAEFICYFKDEETAKRAIKILGVETIKTALS